MSKRTEIIIVYFNDANATPIRDWDYIAYMDGYEEDGHMYGFGCNENEAILNLMEKFIDRGYV